MKVWLSSAGISGFQVKFDVLTGITGYIQKTLMYGEPYSSDQVQSWDVSQDFEINKMIAKADPTGQHIAFLSFQSEHMSGAIETQEFGTEAFVHTVGADPDPYEGLWRNWTFEARIIGFNVTNSYDNGANQISRITQLAPITNTHDCESTEEETIRVPSGVSYVVNHASKINWRVKSTMKLFNDRDCLDVSTGRYNIWNYTDGDNGAANYKYVSLKSAETKDDDGFTRFTVQLDPDTGAYFRQAMENPHKLAVVKRYFVGLRDEDWYHAKGGIFATSDPEDYRWFTTEPVTVTFNCDTGREEYYPFSNGTKCINYDWCGNNYRENFYH